MKTIRLTDWNSILGSLLFAVLAFSLSIYSLFDPSLFGADSRLLAKLFPYIGPIVAAVVLWQLVFYVELGEQIVFRRLAGRKYYKWQQMRSVSAASETTRYLFVPVTKQYFKFELDGKWGVETHSYRVSKKHKEALLSLLQTQQKHEPRS
ncbi:hypothetical protein ACFQY0_10560 [Haloferula chungangensis]|uniref:PH domain-containing protein n=1 Tax=Haloferula chungangensis TaxID=1048331 RepID=A0ABW2L5H1_9BACT